MVSFLFPFPCFYKGKQWFFSLFLCPPPAHIISLCTSQVTTTHLKKWQRSNSKLSMWQRRIKSTFLNRAGTWLLLTPPTTADPWDESRTILLVFLKKHPVLSYLSVFHHTSTRSALSTISHIICLLMPYSFPKSQLCGLHCEGFAKPPTKYSSSTLITPYWNFLYHFPYYVMYSQVCFFLFLSYPETYYSKTYIIGFPEMWMNEWMWVYLPFGSKWHLKITLELSDET